MQHNLRPNWLNKGQILHWNFCKSKYPCMIMPATKPCTDLHYRLAVFR